MLDPSEAKLFRLAIDKIDDITDSSIAKVLTKSFPFLSDFAGLDILPEIHPDIVSSSTDGDNAVVTIAVDGKNGKSYYDVYMIYLDEKWYIQYAWKSKEG